MTDRELLELAAKAAGTEGVISVDHKFIWTKNATERWNPLQDDGDALRLAVKLRLSPMLAETPPGNPEVSFCIANEAGGEWRTTEALHEDPYAATRRAIVRAAAEIGKAMS